MLERYEKIENEYREVYGDSTIVLIKIGSFYQVFGRMVPVVCTILCLRVSKTSCTAGFPHTRLVQCAKTLANKDYTVVLVDKEEGLFGIMTQDFIRVIRPKHFELGACRACWEVYVKELAGSARLTITPGNTHLITLKFYDHGLKECPHGELQNSVVLTPLWIQESLNTWVVKITNADRVKLLMTIHKFDWGNAQ